MEICCLLKKASWITVVISLLTLGITYAQNTITGSVVDENNQPLSGASIKIKGSKNGTTSTTEGKFNISAPTNSLLIISFIGYRTKEISIGTQKTLTIQLDPDPDALDEVVVTALGIKKEKKRVGYAVQELKGESLQKAIAPNVLESITGQVAGLTITNNSGDFFSTPGIYLRGRKPLLVIDGVPSDTDMWNISSDDIENVTVLKSAAASALYGSRGINGAIQITMKSGKSIEKGTTVSLNSSTTFQGDFIRIPQAQSQYGPGNAGQYAFGTGAAGGGGTNDYDYSIWGPKFDGRLIAQFDSPIDPQTGKRIPTPWVARSTDNLRNFMETGIVTSNNISVQSQGEHGNFIISHTYKYAKASQPGSKLNINITRLHGNLKISNLLSLEGSLQYDHQGSNNRLRAVYGPTSAIYNLAIWGGAHFDVRQLKDYWVPGKEGVQQYFVENWRYNNPYALAYAWQKPYEKNDILGNLKLNFNISSKLNAFVRTTLNSYSLTDEEKIAVSIYNYDIGDRGGRYRYSHDKILESNTDILLNYSDNFLNKDLTIEATLGANQRFHNADFYDASTTQLVVPGIFKLSNSVDKVTPTSSKYRKGVYSAYASVDLGYKNWAYLGFTGRVDKSSTLPKANSSFFYPSVSVSTVLTDLFTFPKAINFLKLRASYAKVGGDFDVSDGTYRFYEATNTYETGDRYRNLPIANYPNVLDNPNISPEFNVAYEYGAEARFLNSRLGLEFSYYENNYGPQIFTQVFSQTSGYSGKKLNGKTTQRRGAEITLNAIPIRTDNFSWSTLVNFDKGNTYLKSLPPLPDGTPQTQDGRTKVGDMLNDYWYNEWERSPDGQLVIQPNGLPRRTDVLRLIGHTQGDFTLSMGNTFAYKDFSLNFLIDGRFGGITYDSYERDLWRSGSHPDAIHPERELSNIAYANETDAKTMQIPGVKIVSGGVTYDPEGNILTDTRKFEASTYKVDYQNWAGGYKGAWESNLIEKTFVKLRELTFTYTLPAKLLKQGLIKKASISLVGRNLLYWTKDHTFGDLDTYTLSAGDTALQHPAQRTYGFNLNFNF
ncbi:SusC/RagA family TonB-linked outer membrane protein [Pedobacter nyackensis]|uniref:SusC/RagA family TonB-linked outer membrane protein n=1 Tax=Pedobacter nyackensis TaxID=475255 RepID=UPI00292E3F16|nr:SusC/RagA family TonB-linked outer membrane protein [Pedobacter nyackensis]